MLPASDIHCGHRVLRVRRRSFDTRIVRASQGAWPSRGPGFGPRNQNNPRPINAASGHYQLGVKIHVKLTKGNGNGGHGACTARTCLLDLKKQSGTPCNVNSHVRDLCVGVWVPASQPIRSETLAMVRHCSAAAFPDFKFGIAAVSNIRRAFRVNYRGVQ